MDLYETVVDTTINLFNQSRNQHSEEIADGFLIRVGVASCDVHLVGLLPTKPVLFCFVKHDPPFLQNFSPWIFCSGSAN